MDALLEKYPNIMLIAAGDFNGTSDEPFYDVFTTYPYADTRFATENTSDEITYPDGDKIIDYIFVNSDKVKVSQFKVLSETMDGRLSDHNGTFAALQPRYELDFNEDGMVGLADVLEFAKAESNSALDIICDGVVDSKYMKALLSVVAQSNSVSGDEIADNSLTLSLNATVDSEKKTVTVTLNANTVGNGIFATKFNVIAPEGFTLVDVNSDALAESGYTCTEGQNIVVSRETTANGSLNGEVLTFTYSVSDSVVSGIYEFVLAPVETVDADGNYIATEAVNAEVSITSNTGVDIVGDIDGDGIVTIDDVFALIKAVLEDTPLVNGDISGDDKQNIIDVIRVLKLITQ
jgi:hypothetical protein